MKPIITAALLTWAGIAHATEKPNILFIAVDAALPKSRSTLHPLPKEPSSLPSSGARDLALLQVEENPKLPRVLLIGDSISMGYTLPLRDRLKNIANVQHPPENCRSSRQILERLDQYLGSKPWDVIHFNCGIHDLTYLNSAGEAATPEQGGRPQVPIVEYRANLEQIVARLKRTGAKIIWCATTPIATPAEYRLADDVDRYNAVAEDVMRRHHVRITALDHKIRKRRMSNLTADGVHFTQDGYHELANDLAPAIEKALAAAHEGPVKGSQP